MVRLYVPDSSTTQYILLSSGVLTGPIKFGAPAEPAGALVEYRHPYDVLMEDGIRIFHEKNVLHEEIDATIVYRPIMDYSTPAPTSTYPDRTQFRHGPGLTMTAYANNGIARHQSVSISYPGTINARNVLVSDNGFTTYSSLTTTRTSNNNIYSMSVSWISSIQQINAGTARVFYHYVNYQATSTTTGINTGDNWKQRVSPNAFSTAESMMPVKDQGDKYVDCVIYTFPSGTVNITNLQDCLNVSLFRSLHPHTLPVKEKNYGELAAEAAQKTNANQVNMLSFIRDLRDPIGLISSIRNLSKVRGILDMKAISSGYLSAHYGVLPTISDISEIIEAFQRHRPDKNRFGQRPYYAMYKTSGIQNQQSFDLEQHVRLAISNEDNAFDALLEGFDNVGALPTFENLWDLVPYSFVIDWLVNVGGFLGRIDSILRIARLNIRVTTMSYKLQIRGIYPLVDDDSRFSGPIGLVHYQRWVSGRCPVPPLSLQTNDKPLDHWLEAGALILQRTK